MSLMLVIHDTQSAQISQKEDGHDIYAIMKTYDDDDELLLWYG